MRRVASLCVLALAACSPVARAIVPPAPSPEPLQRESDGRVCRETGLALHIGEMATAELGRQMLAEAGVRILRWVPYGHAVTMEFSADRLTITLDEQNRIHSVLCG